MLHNAFRLQAWRWQRQWLPISLVRNWTQRRRTNCEEEREGEGERGLECLSGKREGGGMNDLVLRFVVVVVVWWMQDGIRGSEGGKAQQCMTGLELREEKINKMTHHVEEEVSWTFSESFECLSPKLWNSQKISSSTLRGSFLDGLQARQRRIVDKRRRNLNADKMSGCHRK